MPSFNVGRAMGAGYEPKEILRYLAGRGYASPYEGSDEDIIRQHLTASGDKVMLPYTYAPDLDTPPPAAALSPLPPGLSGPPASVPGSVPQTGERRNLTPQEQDALWSEQGITPTLLPLNPMDLAMLGLSGPVESTGLPPTLLQMVRYRKPGVSALAREAAASYRQRSVNDLIGAKALEVKAWDYPTLGKSDLLEGRTIRSDIPNQSSIGSSFNEYESLPGVRQVPMREFPGASPRSMFYSADDMKRTRELAEQIRASGEINPLIVAVDAKGPYVLEGGHRLAALHELGAQSVPAQVVLDRDQLVPLPYSNRATLSDLAKKKRK